MADRFQVVKKSQVVWELLALLGDEADGGFRETIAEFFELLVSKLETPSGSNGTPSLLKLDCVRFVEMSFGIALRVPHTELHI